MNLPTSLFVDETVHAREVTLPNGEVHVLYFKELPSVVFKTYNRVQTSANPQDQDTSMARLIAEGVVTPEGGPAMSFEQACKLKLSASTAIFAALLDVNGLSGKKAERSTAESASGTS